MDNNLNLCMRCMNELSEDGICTNCGYNDENPTILPNVLAPHTVIDNRYLVGNAIKSNGESITYIGYDKTLLKKIYIKEFMPHNICKRDEDTDQIIVSSQNLVKYKNYLAEFTELNKFLMKMKSLTHIVSVKDIIFSNNTAYSISDYVDSITLEEYITRNGNTLSWTEIRTFLPPILTTLSLVHNVGRYHLGISPETIIFTDNGELKITGFSIVEERITDSSIIPELYVGYSAPEQYVANGKVGEYSDVYSICAVIYRALTGIVPPESIVRTIDDGLKDITQINDSIPKEVVQIIKAGMSVKVSDRIQTINQLVTKLFEQPQYISEEVVENKSQKFDSKTTVLQKPVSNKKNKPKQKKKAFKYKFAIITFLITFALLIPVFIILTIFVLGEDEKPSDEVNLAVSESNEVLQSQLENNDQQADIKVKEHNVLEITGENTIQMPNLVGLDYDSVLKSGKAEKILEIQPEYKYSDEYDKGIIMSQSISENTYIEQGTKVTVTISKGPSVVTVPDYTGLSKKEYIEILDSLNIKYDVKYMDSYEVLDDYVVRTNKHIGDRIDLLKNDVLIVYISNCLAITETTIETTEEQIME